MQQQLKKLTIRIPERDLEKLEDLSRVTDLPISELVREIINYFLYRRQSTLLDYALETLMKQSGKEETTT